MTKKPDEPEREPAAPTAETDRVGTSAPAGGVQDVAAPEQAEDTNPADPPAPADGPEGAAPPEQAGSTAIYVRRSRTPTLGFWVVMAVVVGTVAGGVIGFVAGVDTVAGVAYFALAGALFIGIPVALVAAVVDAVIHRRRR